MCPTAEQGRHDSLRRGVSPLDPAWPSDLSATPGTGDMAGANDKDGFEGIDGDAGAGPRAWPQGKVFAGARAAVWTETEAGVRAEAGKVFAETGIMTGTGVWAEVGSEWRPGDAEPSLPRDPAAWLGRQRLQTFGMGQREQPAFSSVPTKLAETVELQAPALGKPLGLLSKAAWTRSSSSSSSKSSFTTKAASLPSSTSSSSLSSPSPASNIESQTVASDNVSLVAVNNSSSNNNSSSSLGMFSSSGGQGSSLSFDFSTHMA